jgi:hypothetical protein
MKICSIDELSDEDAHQLRHFNNNQLRSLSLHYRTPEEAILVISFSKMATGDLWTHIIPEFFEMMLAGGATLFSGL